MTDRHFVWWNLNSTEGWRSEEHTSELQSRLHLVCRLLLEKKKNQTHKTAVTPHAGEETARAPHGRPALPLTVGADAVAGRHADRERALEQVGAPKHARSPS